MDTEIAMAGGATGEKGSTGPVRARKKGRQQVSRHWRPTLGRFVETYDRRGEHARPKPPKAGCTGEVAEAESSDGGSSGASSAARKARWLLIAGGVLGVVLIAVTGVVLIDRGPRVIEYDVVPARKPFVVEIDHGPAPRIMAVDVQEFDALVGETVDTVVEAARNHPDRLIVIDLVSPSISFASLSACDQRMVEREWGPRAAEVYESAVARFLEWVVDRVGDPRVSVMGLPVEPGAAGIDAARRTNRCFQRVIERLDHLVTAHIFLRTESWVTEQRMVREAIPEALRRSDGRPIVFRLNLEWRVLVERDDLDRYRRVEWISEAIEPSARVISDQ